MGDLQKVKKLIRKTARIEAKLPRKAKIALAKKRLYKLAGTDDPQEYGSGFGQQDKTDVSSDTMEDKNMEKIIDAMDDEERHVFEALSRKIGKKKLLKLAKDFDESKIKRDDSGEFTSGGGDSSDKSEKKEKKTPAEEGTDAALKDAGFEGVNSDTLDSLQESLGDDVQISDVKDGSVAGNGKLIEMDDGSEWALYENADDAREAAKEQMENLFDDIGIEGWNKDFGEQFITVDDTTAREIAIEDAESQRESIEEDVADDGKKGDRLDTEVEKRLDAMIDETEESIKSDARGYFVEETGQMSDEEFSKADFVTIDTEGLFDASIDTDGIAHTLSSFDGEEVETKDGKLLYRIN